MDCYSIDKNVISQHWQFTFKHFRMKEEEPRENWGQHMTSRSSSQNFWTHSRRKWNAIIEINLPFLHSKQLHGDDFITTEDNFGYKMSLLAPQNCSEDNAGILSWNVPNKEEAAARIPPHRVLRSADGLLANDPGRKERERRQLLWRRLFRPISDPQLGFSQQHEERGSFNLSLRQP